MAKEKRGLVPWQSQPLETFIPPLPRNHGYWTGTIGDSTWMFDLTTQRRDIYNGGHDTWRNVIRHSVYPNADRTDFGQNYPNFSPYLIRVTNNPIYVDADYTFPAGSGLTLNRIWNFRQADQWVAQGVNSTPGDIAYLRRDRKLTWHELENLTQMILVPRVIHGYVPHGGGIEVLRVGPIGAERAALPPMEERVLDGRRALCGKGICQITYTFPIRGTLRDVPVLFYCDDDSGEPTQPQLERAQLFEQVFPQANEAALEALEGYVFDEWPDLYYDGGYKDDLTLAAVQIFPVDTTHGMIDIGFLYDNFAGDPEHGLGARVLGDQDDKIIVGPGDVAL